MPRGTDTMQRYPKSNFTRADVDQRAQDARDGGATAVVTEDDTAYILTVTMPDVPE